MILEIFDKKIHCDNYTENPKIEPNSKIALFCRQIQMLFPDHTEGAIKVYQLGVLSFIVACRHFEHNYKDDLRIFNDLVQDVCKHCEIILWDGYWEKLLLQVSF